jgi:hypothetical protein
MNTYKFEKSICNALNLPHSYIKSDEEWSKETNEHINLNHVRIPSLCAFAGHKHSEKSKRLMSQTLSDGRRKKPKSDLWKSRASQIRKGRRTKILCKSVLYNGTVYPSIKNAAEQNKVHRRVIRKNAIPILS